MSELLDRVRSLLARAGVDTYEPTAAELASPQLLDARIRAVIERNNRLSVHYWPRATHLLRRGEFEKCK